METTVPRAAQPLVRACVRTCVGVVEMQALISKLVLLPAEPSPWSVFRTDDSPFPEQLCSVQ